MRFCIPDLARGTGHCLMGMGCAKGFRVQGKSEALNPVAAVHVPVSRLTFHILSNDVMMSSYSKSKTSQN